MRERDWGVTLIFYIVTISCLNFPEKVQSESVPVRMVLQEVKEGFHVYFDGGVKCQSDCRGQVEGQGLRIDCRVRQGNDGHVDMTFSTGFWTGQWSLVVRWDFLG